MRAQPFECTDLRIYFSHLSAEDYLSLSANLGRAEIPMHQARKLPLELKKQ